MRGAVCVLVVCWLFCTSAVLGADWPQYMGPHRNGTAPDEKLAESWPAGGPETLWTAKVGPGFGGPSIHDGKVYLLDREGEARDVLRCSDFLTGKEEWAFAYDAPGKFEYDGSRSTPTVDDTHVFIIGPFGHIHCVDKATHKPVWAAHLIDDYGGKLPNWGSSQSPLLHDELVIIAPLSPDVGVVALEKATGKLRWKSEAFGGLRFASPYITTLDGVRQVIMSSKSETAGVDLATGKILWRYAGYNCAIPVSEPAHVSDGRFFKTGGYNAGSVMFHVQRLGDTYAVKEIFRLGQLGAQVHLPLVYEDHIYVQCNTNDKQDGLVCIGLDGTVKWKTERSPNFDRGGMVLAQGGRLLAMDGATGILRLIRLDSAEYGELASAKVLDGKQIWAPMALADGKLICRDQKQMKCLVVGAK